jgi:hypothetical protein
MKILLRTVAGWTGFSSLLWLVQQLTRPLTGVVIANLPLMVLALFGAVRLWQLKDSGLVALELLYGISAIVAVVWLLMGGVSQAPVLVMTQSLTVLGILASPWASRQCE